MTALTLTDSDNAEAMEAVFDPQGTDAVFTIDPVLIFCQARQLERDGQDTTGTQAAALSIMEPK